MSDPLDAKIAENRDDERLPDKTAPERTRVPGTSGSLGYAAAIAGSCLVASLALGLGVISVPAVFPAGADEPPGAERTTAGQVPTSWRTTYTSTTTTRTSTTRIPAEFVGTTGPGGLVTVVPYSFTELTARVGSYSSRDPLDPDVEVRYGGAPPEGGGDLLETITRPAARASATASLPCCSSRCWPSSPGRPPTTASACSSACIASG